MIQNTTLKPNLQKVRLVAIAAVLLFMLLITSIYNMNANAADTKFTAQVSQSNFSGVYLTLSNISNDTDSSVVKFDLHLKNFSNSTYGALRASMVIRPDIGSYKETNLFTRSSVAANEDLNAKLTLIYSGIKMTDNIEIYLMSDTQNLQTAFDVTLGDLINNKVFATVMPESDQPTVSTTSTPVTTAPATTAPATTSPVTTTPATTTPQTTSPVTTIPNTIPDITTTTKSVDLPDDNDVQLPAMFNISDFSVNVVPKTDKILSGQSLDVDVVLHRLNVSYPMPDANLELKVNGEVFASNYVEIPQESDAAISFESITAQELALIDENDVINLTGDIEATLCFSKDKCITNKVQASVVDAIIEVVISTKGNSYEMTLKNKGTKAITNLSAVEKIYGPLTLPQTTLAEGEVIVVQVPWDWSKIASLSTLEVAFTGTAEGISGTFGVMNLSEFQSIFTTPQSTQVAGINTTKTTVNPARTNAGGLPVTGAQSMQLAFYAFVLLALGSIAFFFSKRKEEQGHQYNGAQVW